MTDLAPSRNPGPARGSTPPRVIVVMGVAGSGKTTVGQALADEMHWKFRDADEFHPWANIVKMSAGKPLDDADRVPWLEAIRAYVDACLLEQRPAVVTCSALKERYRRIILPDSPLVRLVYLSGRFEVILERLKHRRGHFMRPEMLRSQFDALEQPADALQLDAEAPAALLVAQIRNAFNL